MTTIGSFRIPVGLLGWNAGVLAADMRKLLLVSTHGETFYAPIMDSVFWACIVTF